MYGCVYVRSYFNTTTSNVIIVVCNFYSWMILTSSMILRGTASSVWRRSKRNLIMYVAVCVCVCVCACVRACVHVCVCVHMYVHR